jgi:hypothetical protein
MHATIAHQARICAEVSPFSGKHKKTMQLLHITKNTPVPIATVSFLLLNALEIFAS